MNGTEDPLHIYTDGGTAGGGGGPVGLMNPLVELLTAAGDDLEPQPRNRCNTWPLRRPDDDDAADGGDDVSPLIHQRIPEDDEPDDCVCGSSGELTSLNVPSTAASGAGGAVCDTVSNAGYSPSWTIELASPTQLSPQFDCDTSPTNKKGTTRRNAWGNMSYADLISQAIMSTPEQRLTLSQIYDWMVQNVPYFRDKGDSNSSAGWKNSIRHNLSLHQRFMRVQNEGAGKSSWWVINPDAKPGKASRRRAQTMEAGQAKAILDKKRGRVRKRVEQLKAAGSNASLTAGGGGVNADGTPTLSPTATGDHSPDYLDAFCLDQFRARSDSNLSNYSTPGILSSCGTLSGSHHGPAPFDDLDTYWGINPNAPHPDTIIPSDVVDMTGNIRLSNGIGPIKTELMELIGGGGGGVPANGGIARLPINNGGGLMSSPPHRQGGAVAGSATGGGGGSPYASSSAINYQTSPMKTEALDGGGPSSQQPPPPPSYAQPPPPYQQLYPSDGKMMFQPPANGQQMLPPCEQMSQLVGGELYPTPMMLNGGGGDFYHHQQQQQLLLQNCNGSMPVTSSSCGMFGNPPPAAAQYHHHAYNHQGLLPQDLSSIEINNPVQCNMDEVLIHEFNMGTLDFNNDSVPNFTSN